MTENKNTIECLYFIDGPSMLANTIIHRMAYNRDKDATLMLSDSEFKKFGLYEAIIKLRENGIFQDVIWGNTLVTTDDENDVCAHFDNMLEANKKTLDDFQNIYCMNDDWGGHFSLYLIIKKHDYIWLQSTIETLCDPPREDNIELVKKYNATSIQPQYAVPCFLEQSINNIKNCKKAFLTWNNVEAFKNIDDITLELIGNSFMENSKTYGNGTLLIRNSVPFVYTSNGFSPNNNSFRLKKCLMGYEKDIWSNDVAVNVDKMALDYYGEDGVTYIKYHLFDYKNDEFTKTRYGENFCSMPQIPFQFMIPFFLRNSIKFDCVVSYNSTSTQLLGDADNAISNRNITLGKSFFRTWYFYDSLYLILTYSNSVGVKKIYAPKYIGEQLDNLIKKFDMGIHVIYENKNIYLKEKELLVYDENDISNENQISDIIRKMPNDAILIFLNVDEANNFIPYDYMNYSYPILLEKEFMPSGENLVPDYVKSEKIWICTKSSVNLNLAAKLKLNIVHKNLSTKVYAKCVSKAEAAIEFIEESRRKRIILYEKQIDNLVKINKEVKKQNSLLIKYIVSEQKNNLNRFVKETLMTIWDFKDYIDFINQIKEKYLIILSIKDTPGNNLSATELKKINELGFTKFEKTLWRMYIGVLMKGIILYDCKGAQQEEPLEYKMIFNNLSFEIKSKAWKNGNLSSINVNGEEYAKNRRGINIVIYDIDNHELIDSIAYDAHSKEKNFYR